MYLVTGAAGFIGFHVCKQLLDRGEEVVGVDVVNDYYDPALKYARLQLLEGRDGFVFHKADIADAEAVQSIFAAHSGVTRIIHLAAQAGVRYSLINPYAYTHSNIEGQLVLLEMARKLPKCEHFVYASSSSVYGSNTKIPFSVEDRTDSPVSLYAATKKACELMAHTYSHLYALPTTGLRFFTVYGPWGRPDMAIFSFVKSILADKPIEVFNHGDMRRDFTYIDDIAKGVLTATDAPPAEGKLPYRVYNIGNHRSEELMRLIEVIERSLGKKAQVVFKPMQPGDVKETFADIEPIKREFGFEPSTTIDEGIPAFVQWYREFYRV